VSDLLEGEQAPQGVPGPMTISVPGRPVPKARPRRGAQGNWYTPKTTRDYEAGIAWAAMQTKVRFGDQLVAVFCDFWTSRVGDVDNLHKAVLDGLVQGGTFTDDRQVMLLRSELHRVDVDERTEVEVMTYRS
jgi:crossover junction endodeoxyribonuclease RusA